MIILELLIQFTHSFSAHLKIHPLVGIPTYLPTYLPIYLPTYRPTVQPSDRPLYPWDNPSSTHSIHFRHQTPSYLFIQGICTQRSSTLLDCNVQQWLKSIDFSLADFIHRFSFSWGKSRHLSVKLSASFSPAPAL